MDYTRVQWGTIDKKYRIAISGFGVAGGAAALLLAKQGHHVTVFERRPDLGPVGAAVLLQPSGQIILERMGLLGEVTKNAEPVYSLEAYLHTGKRLTEFRYSDISPETHAYGLHRADLFAVLHDQGLKAGIQLLAGKTVTSAEETNEGVRILSGQEDLGLFDFLLATDGIHSAFPSVKHLVLVDFEYGHGALWLNGISDRIRHKLFQVTEGTRMLRGILPMGNKRCSLFVSMDKKEHAQLSQQAFGPWKHRMVRLIPQGEELLASAKGFEDFRFTTYRHRMLKRWHTKRIVLLGDAAHAMSPHTGQGVNLALADAYNFAQSLKSAPDFLTACTRYVSTRKWHVAYYLALTAGLSPFFQSRGYVKGWARDLALPLMQKIPPLRRWMVKSMAGMVGLTRIL